MIIIKEKKGELRYLKKDYYDFIQSNSNFYVINSLKPKLLNYNQFEEIIPFVDLLITLTATSTTVLQALDKNVPFISVNNDHPFSFYKNYPHCEVNLNNLANAINYWLNINIYDKELQINQIKSTLNLTNDNGFATITNYFREYLDEKNKIYS